MERFGGGSEPRGEGEAEVRIAPLTPADWPVLRDLAQTIWHEHYRTIISASQIEFMLSERLSDDALRRQAAVTDGELAVLWLGERAVGYCGSGPGASAAEFKLEQLYVLAEMRGRRFGRQMLAHVERRAEECGRAWLTLQVNKRNATAIAFYRRAGFHVREEAVFDIGNGYVMDDYVMQKPVGGILPQA